MNLPIIRKWNKNSVELNGKRLAALAFDKRPRRSPLVGIPLSLQYKSNKLTCIAISRSHLAAALSAPGVRHIEYQPETKSLVISGAKIHYALRDQIAVGSRHNVKERLREWSASLTVGVKPNRAKVLRRAERLRQEIEKYERKLTKLTRHFQPPKNPYVIDRESDYAYTETYRRNGSGAWAKGKEIRKKLARLAGPYIRTYSRPSWKEFYANAAKILGVEFIQEAQKHSRICNLKRGPSDFANYLKRLPEYLAHQRKPYPDYYDSPEVVCVQMKQRRQDYVERLREIRNTETSIAALKDKQRDVLKGGN